MTGSPDSNDEIVELLKSGCLRTAAKVISCVERNSESMTPLLRELYCAGLHNRVIGVTGPPGAGKSSLINKLTGVWRKRGSRVAILAVDPSSPFTGGAILGDRLRMNEHGLDDDVFIRSMASRGQLGGLNKATADAITVLEAMPWDYIIVETVGTGQNETDIMRYASAIVLVQTPMGGDDIQAAKAGINEIGDIYAVNKSDHPDAARTCSQLENMITLGLGHGIDGGWRPPVVKTQSMSGEGIDELADHIERFFDGLEADPDVGLERSRRRTRQRVREIMRDRIDRKIFSDGGHIDDKVIDAVVARKGDPYDLADRLLADI